MRTPTTSRPGQLAAATSLAFGLLVLSACGASSTGAGKASATTGTLRVSGSTTVNPVAADAASALRTKDLTITVDTQGGSAGGITQLGQGQIDIAMSSKPVGDADKAMFAKTDFVSTRIGADAVGIVVRKEVYDGGLTAITKDQLRMLFEGKVTNWKQLGGPDLATFVYDKEPGRGTREVLDKFLYGKTGKAPAPPTDNAHYAVVGGNEETRTKLESTQGSVAPLSTGFVLGHPKLVALTVAGITPTNDHVADNTYPLSRPLFLVTNGPPTGAAKAFIDYVLSAPGQALVTRHDYLTLAQLKV